jgi:ParB-like chromosome segregation protein Spo0J
LTADEFQQLKENILKDGCRDALVIWNSTIIDGHNRYRICTENGIELKTVEMEFTDRNDAKAWIIKNQFGRRNLQSFVRGELALKLKPILAKQARERQLSTLKQNSSDVQKSAPRESEQGKVRDELAAIAGTSHDTISKVEKILEKGTPEQIQRA